MIYISPSLLSADFGNLAEEIKSTEKSGADYLHLDIMDGHFVPNITFGAGIVKTCNELTDMPLDVHLMIENPEKYIEDFVKAGADIISIHAETCPHLHRQVTFVKSFGIKVAVALNPATPLDILEYVIDDLDMVLFMSVNPGFSGQSFIPSVIDKIKKFNKRFGSRINKETFLIQVDGGVNDKTIKVLKDNGVNFFVSGSYFYNSKDRKKTIDLLKNI